MVVSLVYLIVVYDVEADRTRHFRTLLRRYLTHVQNSVFEGEVTEGDAVEITERIEQRLEDGESAIIYQMSSEKYVDRTAFGPDPAEESRFL